MNHVDVAADSSTDTKRQTHIPNVRCLLTFFRLRKLIILFRAIMSLKEGPKPQVWISSSRPKSKPAFTRVRLREFCRHEMQPERRMSLLV
jgi:hypothetical protein